MKILIFLLTLSVTLLADTVDTIKVSKSRFIVKTVRVEYDTVDIIIDTLYYHRFGGSGYTVKRGDTISAYTTEIWRPEKPLENTEWWKKGSIQLMPNNLLNYKIDD